MSLDDLREALRSKGLSQRRTDLEVWQGLGVVSVVLNATEVIVLHPYRRFRLDGSGIAEAIKYVRRL